MSIDAIKATWKLGKETINSSQKILLLALADRADEDGFCYPSMQRLLEDTLLSEIIFNKNIKILTEKELIKVIDDKIIQLVYLKIINK